MEDWIILSISSAIAYGIVALKVAYDKKHRELCDSFGLDYRIIALIWLPYCLLVLGFYLFKK